MTGFVILVEHKKSRSKSGGRGEVIGAARVTVLEESEIDCTVRYEAVAGPECLVGGLAVYPRARVYITEPERAQFAELVDRYWGRR